VDARVNAPELLENELLKKRPRRVLLGSTTECFQPAERKYRLTHTILEILNRNKVRYSILTRSPLIEDCLSALKEGYCEGVYFTVSNYRENLSALLEPKSASGAVRYRVIERLAQEGVPVVAYVSPVLPVIFEARGVFDLLRGVRMIEFEGLNFNLGNIDEVIKAVGEIYPDVKERYIGMKAEGALYEEVWKSVAETIAAEAKKAKKKYRLHVHGLRGYFNNRYR
jgi:DNA repair photolyase